MNERYSQPRSRPGSLLPASTDATPAVAREKARTTAVALHYTGRGAPRVTAKGNGLVAQKIIDTARQHGVPLEEDAALVGALARIDLGREIPRELWIAVAHVLAFAWTVAGKKKT
jgi:flagellar biosynthesis protein